MAVNLPYAQISMITYESATPGSVRITVWSAANVFSQDRSSISIVLFTVESGVTNAMSVVNDSTALTL